MRCAGFFKRAFSTGLNQIWATALCKNALHGATRPPSNRRMWVKRVWAASMRGIGLQLVQAAMKASRSESIPQFFVRQHSKRFRVVAWLINTTVLGVWALSRPRGGDPSGWSLRRTSARHTQVRDCPAHTSTSLSLVPVASCWMDGWPLPGFIV